MKRMFFVAVSAFLGISAFCAQPKWISTPFKEYPAKSYMVAVGHGSNLKSAQIAAVNELASQFGRDVSSSAKASSRMKSVTQENGVSTSISSGISEDIIQRVSADNLIGVEIKEHHSEGGKHYALAVLDRAKAKGIYESSVAYNDALVRRAVENSGSGLLDDAASLRFAKELAETNEKYVSRLKVINLDAGMALESRILPAKIVKEKFQETVSNIPVFIFIENDLENQVTQAFASVVSGCGLRTSANSGERYCISGKITMMQRDLKDGGNPQCNYSFEGYMMDTVLSEQLFPINIMGRETSTDINNAVIRSYRSMASKVRTTVNVTLLNYMNSL